MNIRSNHRGSVTRERCSRLQQGDLTRDAASCDEAAVHSQHHQVRGMQPLAQRVSLFFMGEEQQDKTPPNAAVLWARYSQIAFIIPAAVVVGLLVGKVLDSWFHTHWLFLAGVIVGAIAGFVDLIRTVTRDKGLKSE